MKYRKLPIEPFIHLALWLLGYLAIILWVNTLGNFSREQGTLVLPVTLGTLLNAILFYAVSLGLIPRYSVHKKLGVFLGQITGVFAGLALLESLTDYLFFVNYYSSSSTDQGLTDHLILNLAVNLVFLSLALGYGFTKNWIRTERQRQQLKQEMLSAELNFLKAQVNPHFLFNVLNMAFASAAAHGDEQTSGIIEKLANLMRYMLYESNVPEIELTREVAYIESFIELQKLRLSSEIQATVQLEVEGDCSRYRIAPLLLIPFVENAFKHGIRLEEKSGILIKLSVADGKLYFRSENTIAKVQNELERKVGGVGLENLRKRLLLLYPQAHQLRISDNGDLYVAELKLNLN
ncbi:MAG: histidine kinase [Hymenobacteraceae bacterium]|nr:histidine kinase [Hymenobacteraceae bacterium]